MPVLPRRPAPRPLRTVAALAVLVVALTGAGAAAGCGSTGVGPRTWAKTVCGALTPWRTQISDLTGQVQQQMTRATTPTQARQQLVTLLSGAHDASENARRKVAAAGIPDVDGGGRIAKQFVESIAAARDAYGHARDTVSTLDTSRPVPFYDAVTMAFQKLNAEYAASAVNTSKLDSAELRKAFDEVPECR